MTATPVIRPNAVTLHITPDPAFVPRFGARVKAAGGRYSDVRGGHVPDRYVTLPDGHPGLVDEIVEAFPRPRLVITIDRWTAEGFDQGYDQRLASALAHSSNKSLHWSRRDGMKASEAIDAKVRAVSDAFDWRLFLDAWHGQNEAVAARRRAASLEAERSEVLREIGAEALRILDGANDIDPLKSLAERYRGILQGLELEEPARDASPVP